MSDNETERPFAAERAKTGRAKCKKCKCTIEKDCVRIAKLVSNPFSEGKMRSWHHLGCLFEVFAKQRASTKRIEDPEEDVSGWQELSSEDRSTILRKIEEFEESSPFKAAKAKLGESRGQPPKRKNQPADESSPPKAAKKRAGNDGGGSVILSDSIPSRDDAFREFRRVCERVASADAYTEKTAVVRRMFEYGSAGGGFKSDVKLWCKLLLPLAVKRIYNLQSKQLIKLFARVLVQDEDDMLEDLEKGDVAETVRTFFVSSPTLVPAATSTLTVQQVDEFLEKLSHLTKEEDQTQHFRSIVSRCTADDLRTIVRLIKHDLRINAGPKHILSAVDEDAYRAFQMSRDLNAVIERCLESSSSPTSPEKTSTSASSSPGGGKVALSLMTPVLPMLAEACKSVEMAMKKCPNGMLSEIKYDGERVQVHKRAGEFRYYSRSLKPVLPHKVNHFKDYIPKAFPDGDDLILDSEVLMVDNKTGQPLPFGTLGVHKKAEFKNANVCLFVFDCIYYNGEVLLHKTMQERRSVLKKRMKEIPNRIMLSEVQEVNDPRDLAEMIAKVLRMGLEGLVLKDVNGEYEPGQRHWLKVKKDYLLDGAMADSADLVVLGAWYGTGNKGGMMSVFLMGCYDEARNIWVTVTKVHTGHDDATLAQLQDELDMVKIAKDPNRVPSWLRANKPMIPDFVARDPKKQPVWEITGAEFTNQGVHTADGISIRFPRVTRIREDKDWTTATSLSELHVLFNRSSESIDVSALLVENDKKLAIKVKTETKDDDASVSGVKTKGLKKFPSDVTVDKVRVKTEKVLPSTSKIKRENTVDREERAIKTKVVPKDADEQNRAEYYSFVRNDYIEYSAAGSPLNWIEGRKPAKGLPSAARPISTLDPADLRSKAVLPDVRASLAGNFKRKKRQHVHRTLRTVSLGATILGDEDRGKSTHVIHDSTEIPASSLQEYEDVPRTATHVSVSWLEASAKASRMQDVVVHAVQLAADYCDCECNRR